MISGRCFLSSLNLFSLLSVAMFMMKCLLYIYTEGNLRVSMVDHRIWSWLIMFSFSLYMWVYYLYVFYGRLCFFKSWSAIINYTRVSVVINFSSLQLRRGVYVYVKYFAFNVILKNRIFISFSRHNNEVLRKFWPHTKEE